MFNPALIATGHENHHNGGSTFGGAVERGAGYSLGHDLERTLFHLLPAGAAVALALAGVAYLVYRWYSNNKAERSERA
ncbi:hypothetical protein [Mycolicibacterium llatzerense]|uniref:hypothetical protein n=1 Tax=Mycolicibacterium llatzerense TaxID=280871 RepID=UPI0021B6B17F|nr:hypothetical protein [Mycolicibacterium llatzerense]MCT7372987.1 hypothetical protein [Mycolicibacterium llatzerense]